MNLVPNNNLLVFLNANTDPYTNGNGSVSIAELKAVLKRPGGGRPLTDEDVAVYFQPGNPDLTF
jgi:hypothetical protein